LINFLLGEVGFGAIGLIYTGIYVVVATGAAFYQMK
jgi:hypothetical protein